MWSIDRYPYIFVDPLFYDSLSRYQPDEAHFLSKAKTLLPIGWSVHHSSTWFHCMPPNVHLPQQGWKIHISATAANAVDVLGAALPALIGARMPFKFAADRNVLHLLLSKEARRGSSGKFMTIYPVTTSALLDLLDALHSATSGLAGPYILSDRRYRDSRCLFYRYGSLLRQSDLIITGERAPYILSPEGTHVPDMRQPWFSLPPWISDPFTDPSHTAKVDGTLNDGRYVVTSSFRFSNSGGVYLATDRSSGATVVIKEARPLTNIGNAVDDAVTLLRKEHRLLKKLENSGLAPRAIDFFEEWEHSYLVEEFLTGLTLRAHASAYAIALQPRPTRQEIREFVATFRKVSLSLLTAIDTLHTQHGIIFRDLSPKNVIVSENCGVTLLDFEAACENGVDVPTNQFTPGFASTERFTRTFARFEDDYFSLGALMLCYLMPVHSFFGIDSQALQRFATSIEDDYGLPEALGTLVRNLLSSNDGASITAFSIRQQLTSPLRLRKPRPAGKVADDGMRCDATVSSIVDCILRLATPKRVDRLFPSDPKVFVTNPLSVAYGACGVAYSIKRIKGEVPREIVEWMLARPLEQDSYAPGLYVGLAGIAWTYMEIGLPEMAEEILLSTRDHPLLYSSADYFYGLAGWGITNLHFYMSLGHQLYLDNAMEAGEYLLRTRLDTPAGVRWETRNESGDLWIGLAHGASGIALFLLYLYLATGDERFLSTGGLALHFDLNHASFTKRGYRSWPIHSGLGASVVPYWRWGSAGIGAVLLRYLAVTGDESLTPWLEDLLAETSRKYTISPGKFFGLAGLGDFLMDVERFNHPLAERARQGATMVASGLRLFQIERDEGTAFPGVDLQKITCDYGTGGAGIALFLRRICVSQGSDFMVDELISAHSRCKLDSTAGGEGAHACELQRTGLC